MTELGMNNELRDKAIEHLRDARRHFDQQLEAEPVAWVSEGALKRLSNNQIVAAMGSEHDGVKIPLYLHPPKPAAQPQVPEGIIKIERTFEYFSPVTTPKVVVYFAPDDWEARDRFALWLSAAKEES